MLRMVVNADYSRTDYTTVTLSCGHSYEANPIYRYKVGSSQRECRECLKAARERYHEEAMKRKGIK